MHPFLCPNYLEINGVLPTARIAPCREFEIVGIEFAKSINTKFQHKPKYALFKSYLCRFNCMSIKAVKFELVSDLNTASFLLALCRIIAHRESPGEIFLDNTKNFICTAFHIKELYTIFKNLNTEDCVIKQQIRCHFMPSYAPYFTSLWESSIKVAKRL